MQVEQNIKIDKYGNQNIHTIGPKAGVLANLFKNFRE
jgi:hypothetical protein